ncbi:MAG: A/G-specific adenine glycosylase [Acidobacteriota bacterium]
MSHSAVDSPTAGDLLAWYDRARRDLPWRRDTDPYRVWISEIMLQQTQVAVATPYFEAFLERFPTVQALADAPIEQVLATWAGLGYYRRARQLHAAARRVAAGGGKLPRTIEGLLELPGIGPYTAAAVASIAFGVAVPVLDGNVERVMARRLALDLDPKRAAGRRQLLAEAARWIDPQRPGDSNQALMELGASICRPQKPRCLVCPLAIGCRGRLDPERYPQRPTRRAKRRVRLAAAWIRRDDGHVLMLERPGDAELFAGFWELPTVELPPGTDDPIDPTATPRLERQFEADLGLHLTVERRLLGVRHSVTDRAIELEVLAARRRATTGEAGEVAQGRAAAWVALAERVSLPISAMYEKVFRRLAEDDPASPSDI